MRALMKTGGIFLTGLMISSLVFAERPPAQTEFDRFVVFGTSLSDTGNIFVLDRQVNVPPGYDLDGLLVPDSPYPRGGLNMSNGALWITQLARQARLSTSVLPATRSKNPHAANYATDGTRAWPHPGEVTFSDQVDKFLLDVEGTVPPLALITVEIGSNDVRDALGAALLVLQGGGTQADAIGAAQGLFDVSIASIEHELDGLVAAGAQKFLYLTVPPLGITPAVKLLDASLGAGGSVVGLANYLSSSFNSQLEAAFNSLAGPEVEELDLFGISLSILADPAAFGLANVTDPCITPDVEPYVCTNPDEYLFWDGIHPTKAAHGILASEAASVLGLE